MTVLGVTHFWLSYWIHLESEVQNKITLAFHVEYNGTNCFLALTKAEMDTMLHRTQYFVKPNSSTIVTLVEFLGYAITIPSCSAKTFIT